MDDDRTAQPSRAPRKKKKNVPNPSRDQLRTRARAKKTHEVSWSQEYPLRYLSIQLFDSKDQASAVDILY